MTRKLKILLAASEIVPFAKTGGLADVAGSLPKALADLGHDVRAIMPLYRGIVPEDAAPDIVERAIPIIIEGVEYCGALRRGCYPGTDIPVYFVDFRKFFEREGIYQSGPKGFADNLERFSFFSRFALESLRRLDWRPDIIHCNDWQTALMCAHLKTTLSDDPFFASVATVFTIHNLAFQGLCPSEQFPLTGLDEKQFDTNGLEFHGQVNLMKAGLIFADIINAVSEQYSREIQTPEFGCGLEGLLASRGDDLYGVLNGIDYDVWNPATDSLIPANYSPDDLSGKETCKRDLQARSNLPQINAPLFGTISRLADQKGFDLLKEIAADFLAEDVQFVLLGTGEPEYHEFFESLAAGFPEKVAVNLTFDNTLAHQIEAGADIFLMPSRFEPCGLNQLYSLKYGTLPLVRKTGGLADTIVDADAPAGPDRSPNGFVFDRYDSGALLATIKRAIALYRDRDAWHKLQRTGMEQDFSWARSARRYTTLYEKAIAKRRV